MDYPPLQSHAPLMANSNSLAFLIDDNWTGCSSQMLTEQNRWRERAACALISHHCGSTKDHRDSLKFVQEVARFVTSRFFGEKKSLGWSEKTKSLSWHHCTHLYCSPLCLTAAAHAFSNVSYTHIQEYLDHGQSEGGVRPSLSLIGLNHNMGLMCVCCWTTGRLSESLRLCLLFWNSSFFFGAPLRK